MSKKTRKPKRKKGVKIPKKRTSSRNTHRQTAAESVLHAVQEAMPLITNPDWFQGRVEITEDIITLYAYLLELDLLSRWVELAKLHNPILAKLSPILKSMLEKEHDVLITEKDQQVMINLLLRAVQNTPIGDSRAMETLDKEFYEKVKDLYLDLKDIISVFSPMEGNVPALKDLLKLSKIYSFLCLAILKGLEPMEACRAYVSGSKDILAENKFLYPFKAPKPINTFINPQDLKKLKNMDFSALDTAYFELALALAESSKKEVEVVFRKYSDEMADGMDYTLLDLFNNPEYSGPVNLKAYPKELPNGPIPPEVIQDLLYYYARAMRKYVASYNNFDLTDRYQGAKCIIDIHSNETNKEMVAVMALLNNQNPLYTFAKMNKTNAFNITDLEKTISSRYFQYLLPVGFDLTTETIGNQNYILGPIPEF